MKFRMKSRKDDNFLHYDDEVSVRKAKGLDESNGYWIDVKMTMQWGRFFLEMMFTHIGIYNDDDEHWR